MIKHKKVTPIADDSNADKVQPSDWNEDHKIDAVDTDPSSPQPGDVWMLAVGTSPSRVMTLKWVDADGTIVELLSVTR